MTATHTYVIQPLADPYLRCEHCDHTIDGLIIAPGHDEHMRNAPCRHLGLTSTCPSWSPVDGCRCTEHLGEVNHSTLGKPQVSC